MLYPNVSFNKAKDSFQYSLNVAGHNLVESGFKTAAEAAWQCDLARFVLSPFIRRKREYNFPERIARLNESEPISPTVALLLRRLREEFPDASTEKPTDVATITRRIQELTSNINESEGFVREGRALIEIAKKLLTLHHSRLCKVNREALKRVVHGLCKDLDLCEQRAILDDSAVQELDVHLGTLVPRVDLRPELTEPADTAKE